MAITSPARGPGAGIRRYRILPAVAVLLALLLCSAGCTGSGNGVPPAPPASAGSSAAPAGPASAASPAAARPAIALDLVARNMSFGTGTITVPPGAGVTINFHNREQAGSSQVTGIAHNFAVYADPAATVPIFRGDIITGGTDAVYRFTAPSAPGTYYFQCDVHPRAMHGQFIVQ